MPEVRERRRGVGKNAKRSLSFLSKRKWARLHGSHSSETSSGKSFHIRHHSNCCNRTEKRDKGRCTGYACSPDNSHKKWGWVDKIRFETCEAR